MRIEKRQKTVVVDYNVYIANDGQEFASAELCRDHEKMLDGTRITCPECDGKKGYRGKWIEPYDHWDGPMGGYYEWHTCSRCGGKGYLEKKTTWE